MAVCDIPDYEFENLARSFLPEMQKFFASEEGKAEYEKWLSEQESEEKKKQLEMLFGFMGYMWDICGLYDDFTKYK